MKLKKMRKLVMKQLELEDIKCRTPFLILLGDNIESGVAASVIIDSAIFKVLSDIIIEEFGKLCDSSEGLRGRYNEFISNDSTMSPSLISL